MWWVSEGGDGGVASCFVMGFESCASVGNAIACSIKMNYGE